MALSRPPRDPAHEPLRQVRRGLLQLHKTLIDAERAAFEAEHGPASSTEFLRVLMEDPVFQWLRHYSGLIVEMDEALAQRERPLEPADALGFVERVSTLLAPAPPGVFTTARLDEVRRRDAGVQLAVGELSRSVAIALEAYRG